MSANGIPAELRDLQQWVVWRYEERDGKPTKVPYRADKPTVRASSTDPSTWGTYAAACAAAVAADLIGFVFSEGDPYAGVDLDHCVDGEDINPHAANVLRELDSYAEFSPSGTGLHVIVRATVNGGRNRTGRTPWGAEFENYDRGRFFCMTGRHVPDAPRTVNERQRQLDAVRAKMFPPEEVRKSPEQVVTAGDDSELLVLAGRAKNGADFDALYRGQYAHGSQSEADLALCNLLAFWCGPDPGHIDGLFRGSGLMRPKWDTTRGETTYGAQTIEKALDGRTDFYGDRRVSAETSAPAPQTIDPGEPTEGEGRYEPAPAKDEVPDQTGPSRVAAMLGEPVDLLSIDTSQPRPWTRGAKRIMRPGLRSIWFGSRGSGKSIAALILSVQVVEAGGSAIYIDFENGPRRQAERLEAILADRPAATRAAVAQRLDYRPNPRLGKLGNEVAIAEWAAPFAGRDLAVIDSAARVLAQLGLDENAAADFGQFMTRYVDPVAAQGTGVLLLDNTGNDEQTRTRGSSTKLDLTELAYKVTSTDIAPDRHGSITLDQTRTRDGDEAHQLIVNVGDGCYSTVHQPDAGECEMALSDTLTEYVQDHPDESTEAVAKALHLRPSRVRDGLAILEAAGTVINRPSQTTDGRGRPHNRKGWYLASESQLTTVPPSGTDRDGHNTAANDRPTVPVYIDGTGTDRSEIERAEVLADRAARDYRERP
jgi:putative DNA primase/helicase